MSPERPLNRKRQRFLEEYLVDLNGAQAAIRAGYKPSRAKATASRMLATDGNLARAVERELAKRAAASKDTAEKIRDEAREAQAEAASKGQYMAVQKLLELRARLGGMLIDKLETSGDGGIQRVIVTVAAPGSGMPVLQQGGNQPPAIEATVVSSDHALVAITPNGVGNAPPTPQDGQGCPSETKVT